LFRIALKLATGAGKTTVMAMLMAWQVVNAVRHPKSRQFTRGFLIVTPGITIRDRLRVLKPNDPDSYYRGRELVPNDMLADLERAKIIITNYHAFKLRERIAITPVGRALLQGRGPELDTVETEGQMIQRVMPELMGMKNILVMNGESIRCVVSVSMLTEGWDANTVTHVLGVRAFGTQLLCEQVVGRALRRQSYDLNEASLFNVEYADVLGIPFDFTATPVVAKPAPPRETIRVQAVRPDRDGLEIVFPRVEGYRVELPNELLTAHFSPDSTLILSPDIVGPSITHNRGILGEGVDLTLQHLQEMRQSTLLFHLAKRLLYTKYRDPGEEPKLYLFGQLKRITRQWLEGGYLQCTGGTYPAQLLYQEIADLACEKIKSAITASLLGDRPVKGILDPYNPTGSTRFVHFTTSRETRWRTDPRRCHINWVVCDSDWEAEFCRVAEAHPLVRAYVKNQGLGLEVPYLMGSTRRKYLPDFIVQIDDGHDDPLNLVVEIKGFRGEDAKEKANTMQVYWVPGVNHLGKFGRWAFAEFTAVFEIQAEFDKLVTSILSH
ncbi:MAG: DEAD/DEAH box helicase family protein, partial [Magnetococcus sp. YQC-5]